MTVTQIIEAIFYLLAGLGVFLIGIKTMGDNLEALAGNKLKTMFNRISNNRFAGVAVGAGVTAVVQSSSATTVMVVGFVNAGVMTLNQATAIIMGANIGTTITAQIVALQFLPITAGFAALACVGAFMQMSKKDNLNKIGSILAGVGVLFVGLYVMSSSMGEISKNPAISTFIQNTTNPFVLFLIGAALTAVIQSSAATTSILIGLGGSGLITIRSAIFCTLGINIGTCITAILASIGATANGKRTSFIHFSFNMFGSIVFFIIGMCMPLSAYDTISRSFGGQIETQIAMFHTLFNVSTTLLLLPFVKQVARLSELVIPDRKRKADAARVTAAPPASPVHPPSEHRLLYLDDRFLGTPSIAIMMVRKEILSMAAMAKENLDISMRAIETLDLAKSEEFKKRESYIDYLNAEVTRYLVNISAEHISYINEKEVASYYHVLSDIERVGDYAENIMEYAQELIDNNAKFSEIATSQLGDMKSTIDRLYSSVIDAFANRNIGADEEISRIEEEVDDYQEKLAREHIERLEKGLCSAEAAGVFLSLISNLERIADHFRNVFRSMRNYVHAPLKTKATIVAAPKEN